MRLKRPFSKLYSASIRRNCALIYHRALNNRCWQISQTHFGTAVSLSIGGKMLFPASDNPNISLFSSASVAPSPSSLLLRSFSFSWQAHFQLLLFSFPCFREDRRPKIDELPENVNFLFQGCLFVGDLGTLETSWCPDGTFSGLLKGLPLSWSTTGRLLILMAKFGTVANVYVATPSKL